MSGPPYHEAPPDSKISSAEGRLYWESIDADVNGMLGGYPSVSKVDLRGSRSFLAKLGIGTGAGQHKVARALEGGAGIGRITEGLLVDVAGRVDVVEPMAKFTAKLSGKAGVGTIYNVGLEEWQPPAGGEAYDLIWTQWCVGHLTDSQLASYLQTCKRVVVPETGLIVLKENISASGEDLFDEVDSTVTREEGKFLSLFEEVGLRVVRMELQKGFPSALFPVKMFALRPKLGGEETEVKLG